MKVKEIWTESDFENMGWHDCHIHSFSFPSQDLEISLDIDYLFSWVLDDKLKRYNFFVSPCILIFFNVINLKIDIDFHNTIGIDILDIKRNNFRLSPNGKIPLWDFEIIADKGCFNFESSGYNQVVKKQPQYSQSQILTREKW